MAKKTYSTTTLRINYSDKIKLVKTLLGIYSVTKEHLTPRDIDAMTMCILGDMNSDSFIDDVLAELNANSRENVNTMMSRLKKKGLIDKHPVKNKKILSSNMEVIKNLTTSGSNIGLQLLFSRDGR
jgi:hypothetical protein